MVTQKDEIPVSTLENKLLAMEGDFAVCLVSVGSRDLTDQKFKRVSDIFPHPKFRIMTAMTLIGSFRFMKYTIIGDVCSCYNFGNLHEINRIRVSQ